MRKSTESQTKMISESSSLRQYEPETLQGKRGMVTMQLVEELDVESGRWEPFYAILAGRENAF